MPRTLKRGVFSLESRAAQGFPRNGLIRRVKSAPHHRPHSPISSTHRHFFHLGDDLPFQVPRADLFPEMRQNGDRLSERV